MLLLRSKCGVCLLYVKFINVVTKYIIHFPCHTCCVFQVLDMEMPKKKKKNHSRIIFRHSACFLNLVAVEHNVEISEEHRKLRQNCECEMFFGLVGP